MCFEVVYQLFVFGDLFVGLMLCQGQCLGLFVVVVQYQGVDCVGYFYQQCVVLFFGYVVGLYYFVEQDFDVDFMVGVVYVIGVVDEVGVVGIVVQVEFDLCQLGYVQVVVFVYYFCVQFVVVDVQIIVGFVVDIGVGFFV